MSAFDKALIAFTLEYGEAGTSENWKLTVIAWLARSLAQKEAKR